MFVLPSTSTRTRIIRTNLLFSPSYRGLTYGFILVGSGYLYNLFLTCIRARTVSSLIAVVMSSNIS